MLNMRTATAKGPKELNRECTLIDANKLSALYLWESLNFLTLNGWLERVSSLSRALLRRN
jgi:hypothetical protein